MPRRRVVQKRAILPDPKFGDKLVAKFINNIMRCGKKSNAETILYKAFDTIQEKTKQDPLKIFKQAVENTKPVLEVRSRRVGGATYQVPIEVRYERRQSLAFRWLLGFSLKRNEHSMHEKLAAELLDAANNRGATIKKREDTHKMADANKAFAHYRW
jgi:small subunit ribosomal protein S7